MNISDRYKFDAIEMINNQPISKDKMVMLVDCLEGIQKTSFGHINRGKYPNLYLIRILIEEVEKRDWVLRNKQLEEVIESLKTNPINVYDFSDIESDRKRYSQGNYYIVELGDINVRINRLLREVRHFQKEW